MSSAPLKTAVENVKRILKNGKIKPEVKPKAEPKEKKKEKNIIRIKDIKKRVNKPAPKDTKKSTERGVIYIGHIPHGFYEPQIREYFSQFGRVTNVRVSRSKKTGKSKGFAFVEFLHKDVAKIAAESMNNYLMFGRLIKTEYIEPERQHDGYFKGYKWSEKSFPRLHRQKKAVKRLNNPVPNEKHTEFVRKSVKNLSKLSETLKSAGINLKFKLGEVVL